MPPALEGRPHGVASIITASARLETARPGGNHAAWWRVSSDNICHKQTRADARGGHMDAAAAAGSKKEMKAESETSAGKGRPREAHGLPAQQTAVSTPRRGLCRIDPPAMIDFSESSQSCSRCLSRVWLSSVERGWSVPSGWTPSLRKCV